ncbi:MAG: phosphate regulon sensor histidine kinase PhoR [Pseudomonadota bacterium]|jgi:two-component system phosphate regulon sensor histidine kinase PhoR
MWTIWKIEILSTLKWLLVAIGLSALIGHFLLWLWLITLGLLIRQIRYANRLEEWLRFGALGKAPMAKGIWEDIYYHLFRLKKIEKRRKKELAKRIEQFHKSTEALPDATVVLNANDEITWSNAAARQMLGLKKSDKGQRILNLIRFPEFNQFLKDKDYTRQLLINSPLNDQIILEIKIVIYDKGLRLLLARDITQFKQMERMRKDFVANVSHELRTPLTVLKGYLETLTDADDPALETYHDSLSQMYQQTDRMQHLIDDLLLLSRLETQEKKSECVDVAALLTQICQESDYLAFVNQRIELIIETRQKIYANEQELRSAFTNLVVNALKYSPENTLVKVHWYQQHQQLYLSVIDQGEGISAIDLPRVTERFYRVENKRQRKSNGTGLGLAIVKHVLVRHQAQLHIESELGKGSCFRCEFPSQLFCLN